MSCTLLDNRDELISDVLLWTPTHGRAKARRPAWTYIQQLCEDTGCWPEDLPEAMNDKEKWKERVRDIRATSTTWWWWWFFSDDGMHICLLNIQVSKWLSQWIQSVVQLPGLFQKSLQILVHFSSIFFSKYFVNVQMVQTCYSTDIATAWN